MAQFVNMHKVELSNGIAPVVSLRQIFYGDVDANRIGAIVQMNGAPVALGGTCSGTAILADGSTVALTGTVSGNEAYVVLPAGCYSMEGQIQVFVKLTVSGVTTTLLAAVGTVRLTETDQIIDPGTIIPSVSALIEAIDAAVESIPADYSALLASIAPTFSTTEDYAAGNYAWYNGTLYRFTANHAAGSWTGTDAAAAVIGNDLTDLKSAIDEVTVIPKVVSSVTDNITQTKAGVTYYKIDEDSVGIYGTSGSAAQRFACFNGNNLFSTQTSGNPDKNMQAGTYKLIMSGDTSSKVELYYTKTTFGAGVKITNNEAFTVDSAFALFVLVYKNTNMGTVDEPTVLTVELYDKETSEPTAIDNVARSEIESLKKIKYVSTSGSNDNNGDTPGTPYATIAKALSETANIIYLKNGIYTENAIPENAAYRYSGVKIVGNGATIKMNTQGLQFRYANVDINDLTLDVTDASNTSSYGLLLLNCTGTIRDCTIIGAKGAGGYRLDGSKITLVRCTASNCAVDGFNGHTVNTGYETEATLIDCIAHGCGDDGASIHESGKMYVIGGEYYNNVQTGLAPHDLCVFEALNVHCHNNGIGIEAVKDTLSTGETPATGRVIGCILDHNTTYGLDVKNYTVNALGNAYADNGTGKTRAGTGATINAFTVD